MYRCIKCDRLLRVGETRCRCGRSTHISPPTPYNDEWPPWDGGTDAFSMEDSWLDRTGAVKKS